MCLYSSNDNLWYNEGGISLPVTKTVLAKDIDMENLDIRYDKSVRRILVNIPILARIIKPVVTELQYYQLPVIEKCIDKNSIQIGNVFVEPGLTNKKIINDELEDKIPYEGRIIYDIRFSIILPDGSSRKIIINVEAQQKGNPGYSLLNRGVFYAARLISAQLSVEFTNDGSDKEQYDNMKQVYSIWICMDCPADKKDSIITYSLDPHIIYQGHDNVKPYPNCSLINIIFIHLSGKPDQSQNQLIAMLDTLLARMDVKTKKQKLEKEHNIPMTIELEKEMSYMCNLSSGIREEAIRDGIMIGEHNGEINALKNMLKANLVTIEKLKSSGLYSPDVLAALRN